VEKFSQFVEKNFRIINKISKSGKNLFVKEYKGTLPLMPNVLDFYNKREFFMDKLAKIKAKREEGMGNSDRLNLVIKRTEIFTNAYVQIKNMSVDQMKKRLHVDFTGEVGIDAGGLTKDFFSELSKEIFNAERKLFCVASNGSTYYPSPKSNLEKEYVDKFKFIGRVIGKALYEECLLECYFVKPIYKIVLGEQITLKDLESYDNQLYKAFTWMLANDITPMDQRFVVEAQYSATGEDEDLIPGGSHIPVTNENKSQFLEKLIYYKLYGCIQKQIESFVEGFEELIPKDLINIFTPN